jgi:hypothetical protein
MGVMYVCDAGSVLVPNMVSSLEQTKEGNTDEVLSNSREGLTNLGFQDSMGIASSPRTNGKSPVLSWASPNTAKSSFSLTLMEGSSQIVSARPNMEEFIAFGGIPTTSLGVSTSDRLGCQPGADMPQMEKAMLNAQLKDASSTVGKPIPHSIVNIPDSETIHRADRLGISLGQSNWKVVKSIKGLKLLEEERILTILQKNVNENVNKEEGSSTIVMSKVSTLCEDLIEDDGIPLDLDDHLGHLKPVVKEKKTRTKKVYDTINVRKSTRRRIKKQFS